MSTMITDAAVEAGASAISARHLSNTGVPFPIKACRDDARVALEAALAHLAAVKQSLTVAPSVDAWAVADIVRSDLDRQSCPDAYMRIAVESIVKHLTATPEAGNPVSVGQEDALRSFACEAVEYFRNRSDVVDGDYGSSSPNEEMKLLSEGEDALAARQPMCSSCNGVGLIPYTIGQTAESFEQGEYPCPDCAARQPVGEEPFAWHFFDHNPMLAQPANGFTMDAETARAMNGRPLYTTPPAQQPAPKVDVEDVLGKALDMAKAGAGAAGLVEWIAEQLIEEDE